MTDGLKVINYLDSRYPEWVRSCELSGVETEFGFIGSQGDKRARELAPGMGKDKYFRHNGKYGNVNYEIEGDKKQDLRGSQERVYRLRIVENDLESRYSRAVEYYKKIMSFENVGIAKMINEVRICKYEDVKIRKMETVITEIGSITYPQTQPSKKAEK